MATATITQSEPVLVTVTLREYNDQGKDNTNNQAGNPNLRLWQEYLEYLRNNGILPKNKLEGHLSFKKKFDKIRVTPLHHSPLTTTKKTFIIDFDWLIKENTSNQTKNWSVVKFEKSNLTLTIEKNILRKIKIYATRMP